MYRFFSLTIFCLCAFSFANGQPSAKNIFETEKAFEKAVSERGMKAGFIEYLAPLGVMFFPEAMNAREAWGKRPDSSAALTWNPLWIDVASNGALAYSIGNSVFKPNGNNDTNAIYGHYLSIWGRQPNGSYLALLDIGTDHDKPVTMLTEYKSPFDIAGDTNDAKLSAADSAVGFYNMVDAGSIRAYKTYLADDAILMRSGKEPFWGKKAAVKFLEGQRPRIKFAKRKAFIESPDLAYVYNTYTLINSKGVETERGNFVQVWKLRKGKWLIAADVLTVIPPKPRS